jgi:hypothetical protein
LVIGLLPFKGGEQALDLGAGVIFQGDEGGCLGGVALNCDRLVVPEVSDHEVVAGVTRAAADFGINVGGGSDVDDVGVQIRIS